MARYNIIGLDGNIKAEAEMAYSHTFMEIPKLTCTLQSADNISFVAGDYVIYPIGGVDVKFSLDRHPSSKQTAYIRSSGRAITYTLTFYPDEKVLTQAIMKDVVPADNNIHYTGLSVFTAYCTPKDFAARLQANLDIINDAYGYTDDDRWQIELPALSSETSEKGVDLSFTDTTVWDGLRMFYDEYNISFIISSHKITLLDNSSEVFPYPITFAYGKGNGLVDISESVSEEDIVTRLTVYGGTENLPLDYSKRIDSTGLRYTPNLMLPVYFESNGKIDYIEDPEAVKEFGVRWGSITFDEVHPTIKEVTIGDYAGNGDTTRIDEVALVVSDAVTYNPKTFKIWVNFPFDLNEYSEANQSKYFVKDNTKVSFKDGWLGGYEFPLLSVELISEPYLYELTLERIENEDSGENNVTYLPDTFVKAKEGDHFVLVGCFMPEQFTIIAQNRLESKGLDTYESISIAQHSYALNFDNIYLQRNPLASNLLKCGQYIQFDYLDKKGLIYPIQQVDIKEGVGGIREYKVFLAEKPSQPLLRKLSKELRQNRVNADAGTKHLERIDRRLVAFEQEVTPNIHTRLSNWENYNPADNTSVLGSQLGYELKQGIENVPSTIPVYFDFRHIKTPEGEDTENIEIVNAVAIESALQKLDKGHTPFARISESQSVAFTIFESVGTIVPIQIASWNNDSEFLRATLNFIYNEQEYEVTINQDSEPVVSLKKVAKTPIKSDGIADGAVTTPKIYRRAVTSEKIAERAVTSEHIALNAITEEHLSQALRDKINDDAGYVWVFSGENATTQATEASQTTVYRRI